MLTTEDSAAPRNDLHFIIWGMVTLESQTDDSHARFPFPILIVTPALFGTTNRLSLASWHRGGEFVHLVTPEGPERERVLVAATIEQWLAQLTSALDYDELLAFFPHLPILHLSARSLLLVDMSLSLGARM